MKPFVSVFVCLSACVSFVDASINIVNQGFFTEPDLRTIISQSIDVGADADMLIIGVGAEIGPPEGGVINPRYGNSNFMSLATGNFQHSSIFYLDLTDISYIGNLDLNILQSYDKGGSFGVSWVSIDGNLEVGQSIQLHNTSSSTESSSVDLESTIDDTFNFVHFTANKNGNTASISMSENLSEIYAIEDNFGSARHGSGFETIASAGTNTYNWVVSTAEYRRIDAAAFAVVAEPSAVAIWLGISCLTTVITCRRR